MSIFKKKTKLSPSMFTLTFYIGLLGFLFGAFGLGFGLLNSIAIRSGDTSLATSNFQTYTGYTNLKYCYEHDIKPCSADTIHTYQTAHPNE